LRDWILEAQGFSCLACSAPLKDVEFDHIIPHGLGGGNTPENWAALCPVCHRQKTKLDLRRIAEAKRQRRYHETGRSRAPRASGPLGPAKGFNKMLRRHLNSVVRSRCRCKVCSAQHSEH
jgi:hypothetical protein